MLHTERRIAMLTIDDVAWLLGTDIKTVQRWANSGIIKACRATGCSKPIFRRDDVAHLLAMIGA